MDTSTVGNGETDSVTPNIITEEVSTTVIKSSTYSTPGNWLTANNQMDGSISADFTSVTSSTDTDGLTSAIDKVQTDMVSHSVLTTMVPTDSSDVTTLSTAYSSDVITITTNSSDVITEYIEGSEEEEGGWPLYKQIIVGVILFTICFVIVAGNTLTILVFLRDAKIRSVQNMYIFNLALTDMLIGCSSVPFYAIYTVLDFEWVLGYEYCKVWSTVDYWVCAESSLTIILISHDRLLMVTKGATYIHAETKTKALVKILITWLISFLIYGPAVIGYNYWRGYSTLEEGVCDVEFATEFWYTTMTAFIEFCVPFVLLVTFSCLLYRNLRKRTKRLSKASSSSKNTVTVISLDNKTGNDPASGATTTATTAKKHESSTTLSKDKKAARSLAILVITYAICWTPYTIITVIYAFCDTCVHDDAYEVAVWLLWINSAFNPVLYAATNQRFRKNFEFLLCRLINKERIYPVKSSTQGEQAQQTSKTTTTSKT